jgi:hypothetical protein
MSDEKRSFSVVYENKKHLFKGTSPLSVSKKVIKKLCKLYKKKEVKFELNETTKDSKKKKYGPYIGHMEDLKAKVCFVGGAKKRGKKPTVNPVDIQFPYTTYSNTSENRRNSELRELYNQLYKETDLQERESILEFISRYKTAIIKREKEEQAIVNKYDESDEYDEYNKLVTNSGITKTKNKLNKKPRQNDSRLKIGHPRYINNYNSNNEIRPEQNNNNNNNNNNNLL